MSTGIEWTDETWNPVIGCTEVSPGCDHCYAETIATRFAGSKAFPNGFSVTLHPDRLEQPLRWRKPRRVFVNSMSDLFHADVPDDYILRVWQVMADTTQHTYQVLTKRHGRMRSFLRRVAFRTPTTEERQVGIRGRRVYLFDSADVNQRLGDVAPLENVWLGVSVEDQKHADLRIPALLETPAAVRFLSCEPLLGPVDLSAWMPAGRCRWQCSGCRRFYSGDVKETCPGCGRVGYLCGSHIGNGRPNGQPIDWVIVGGESGPKARPMHPDWARDLRDQCAAARVPFFFKQWGAWSPVGPDDDAGHSIFDYVTNDDRVQIVDQSGRRRGRPWPGWVVQDSTRDAASMRRYGKHAAGRVLDGRTWDDYPATPGTRRSGSKPAVAAGL